MGYVMKYPYLWYPYLKQNVGDIHRVINLNLYIYSWFLTEPLEGNKF